MTASPWLDLPAFDSTPESFREHAAAIVSMLRGDARVWLGSFPRPRLIGALSQPAPEVCDPAGPDDPRVPSSRRCAGCTCALAAVAVPDPDPVHIALVVPTSGSTGRPKAVAHSLQTLKASIHASAHFLGGHGAWIPLLPPTHIAGIQVIARGALASDLLDLGETGGLPAAVGPVPDLRESFGPATVRRQLERWDRRPGPAEARALPLFTSLVPTQLERLVSAALEHGERAYQSDAATDLRRFEAILVGGAAISRSLLERAGRLGARIVTTYGSSETAGGCVYDGEPLRGTEVKVADDGRLMMTAPSLALGYVYSTGAFVNITGNDERTRASFFRMPELASARLFLTSDLATLEANAATGGTRVRILGRADDVINSGGRKIVPQAVEAVLADTGEFADALVVGVPDQEWGQQAVALVVPKVRGEHATQTWRADLSTSLTIATTVASAGLERYMIPRQVITVHELPTLPSGKVDRQAATALAEEALATFADVDAAKRTVTFAEDDDDHLSFEVGGNEPEPTVSAGGSDGTDDDDKDVQ